MSDYRDLAARIEAIAEEIDDRAFGDLTEAVAARAGVRPAADKQMMQARRALEKAAAALRSIDGTADETADD
ncbi:MAG: hypothetical protein ABWZ42_11395 [Ilumatobacteraceae bacterium]